MTRKDYNYYAQMVFEQAAYDPDVDHLDKDDIIEYSDEIAELIVLDPDELRSEVTRLVEIHAMSNF